MLGILAILGRHVRLRRRPRGDARGHRSRPSNSGRRPASAITTWNGPSTGAQNNHYFVTVRGGEVRKVESIRPDGQRFALKPADTRYYSVDGLFLTIADELALLKTDHPFGQPKGTKVVMRFKPDPKLGYPHWYRRDVMGTSLAIAIDVVKLVPKAPLEATKGGQTSSKP